MALYSCRILMAVAAGLPANSVACPIENAGIPACANEKWSEPEIVALLRLVVRRDFQIQSRGDLLRQRADAWSAPRP